MEELNQTWKAPIENRLTFKGSGGSLFEIYLINYLLGLATFGMYYPWGRARKLKYIYSETSFHGSRLAFHGTGREMFIGFIKAVLILLLFYGMAFYGLYSLFADANAEFHLQLPAISQAMVLSAYGVIIAFFILLFPLALHGAFKYRLAKTSWRGIRFGYRGSRGELYKIFLRDLLITIVSLGIYRSWFEVNIRKYVVGNIRFGDVRFSFDGEGDQLIVINLKGIALTIVTFGVYYFWYQKELYDYKTRHVRIHHNGVVYKVHSSATVSGLVELILINWIMVTFTFGVATPWAVARQLRFYLSNAVIDENFNPALVIQTEEEYNDALAEDLSDMFDLGFI